MYSVDQTLLDILQRPGVYLYIANRKVLYVGKSERLGNRAFALDGKGRGATDRNAALQTADVILLPCASSKDAKGLESLLIVLLNPKYNKQRS